MRVIGTAGHIDHGKSTLVRRLTGIDPDRLSEEKRRGMTIDLGFAWLTLPSGTEASIVDVPGHERFVKNMLAGAAGVDVALLTVAADEMVMPQTREHLDILDLLGVSAGVVALTKIDLVDGEWAALAREEVERALRHTTLEGSEIIPVSASTGEGLPALVAALDRALVTSRAPTDIGRPFVPVDRVFTLPGFGTIATGTLHGGRLSLETETEIVPGHTRVRIRGLQTHRKQETSAHAGSRVALNLAQLLTEQIQRGDVIALVGAVAETRRLDARVRVLSSAPFPLRHGMRVAVYIGAAERPATLSVLSSDEIEPGEGAWVQVRFDEPVAAVKDQPFVLRLPAPARTVAGGTVADIAPRHRRTDAGALKRLHVLAEGQAEEAVLASLSGGRPRLLHQVAVSTGMSEDEAKQHLRTLLNRGQVISLERRLLTRDAWDALRLQVVELLRGHHGDNPLAAGMPKEELRSRVGWHFGDWPAVLHSLSEQGVVREHGPLVALPAHSGGTASRRAEVDRVLSELRSSPYSPPNVTDLVASTGADRRLLSAMASEGLIVRVADNVYFDSATYDGMLAATVRAIHDGEPVTV
ncbi:MAG TPA: selenocysteine-specific translation elongation factor, partial [Chloroflexota bacterium]